MDAPDVATEAEDLENHYHGMLFDGLDELDDRSKDIIQSRWLLEPKITLQELADKYGVSAERIRQLEAAALKKLRAHFSA
jgi:RNA polymerase sigma-32 factor